MNAPVPVNAPSTTAEVCVLLGRAEIAARVGRGVTAVSNHAVEGTFPAAWFLIMREMCAEKGVECPTHLFRFAQPRGHLTPQTRSPTETAPCSQTVTG